MKNKMLSWSFSKQHFSSIFFPSVESTAYVPLNAEAEADRRKTIGIETEGLYRLKASVPLLGTMLEALHCGSWNWNIIGD